MKWVKTCDVSSIDKEISKDILTLDFHSINQIPFSMASQSLVILHNKLYIFGGVTKLNNDCRYYRTNDLFEYNIDLKQWKKIQQKGQIPSSRDSHSCVIYKDNMYIYGGGSYRIWYNDFYVFNFKKNEWKKIDDGKENFIPKKLAGHSSNVYKDKMYIFGGWCGDSASNDFFYYDFKLKKWYYEPISSKNKIIPKARDSHSTFIYKDKLFIIGGGVYNDRFDELFTYDFNTHCFELVKKHQQFARCGSIVSLYKDKLFIFGGDRYDINKKKIVYNVDLKKEKKDPILPYKSFYCLHLKDKEQYKLTQIIPLQPFEQIPLNYYGSKGVLYRNKLFIFGGFSDNFQQKPYSLYEFELEESNDVKNMKNNLLKSLKKNIKNGNIKINFQNKT